MHILRGCKKVYKAVVFYFSGTGNTWWVAKQIKKQLDVKSINADIVSVDTVNPKQADWWIKSSDLVLFGWPIYGSDMPEPMKQFIDRLYTVDKRKHIHTFCTQMKFSGDGAWFYHKQFEEKGLIIDSCEHFDMPSNLSMLGGLLGPPKSADKISRILQHCKSRIQKYVECLLGGKARCKGKRSYPLGIVQRGPYQLMYQKMQNRVAVNEDKCTKCGLCAALCPKNNIKLRDYPVFSGNCALCLRCFSFCPERAISLFGRSPKQDKPYSVSDKSFTPSILINNYVK